jgi:uncharacterized membrane protein YhaH (DUF805 family)
MQQQDPYAAPKSNIGDMDQPQYGEAKAFSFSGRIGRIRYMAYSMGMMLLFSFIAGILGAAMAPIMSDPSGEAAGVVSGLLMIVVYAFIVVASFVLAIRRLNDFDASGWWSLLLFVPLVNGIFGLALWFVPGTKGGNRFGPEPPPNTGGAIFLALLMPIIAVIGILAAIAIPQYQAYVEKAAEIQSQQQP